MGGLDGLCLLETMRSRPPLRQRCPGTFQQLRIVEFLPTLLQQRSLRPSGGYPVVAVRLPRRDLQPPGLQLPVALDPLLFLGSSSSGGRLLGALSPSRRSPEQVLSSARRLASSRAPSGRHGRLPRCLARSTASLASALLSAASAPAVSASAARRPRRATPPIAPRPALASSPRGPCPFRGVRACPGFVIAGTPSPVRLPIPPASLRIRAMDGSRRVASATGPGVPRCHGPRWSSQRAGLLSGRRQPSFRAGARLSVGLLSSPGAWPGRLPLPPSPSPVAGGLLFGLDRQRPSPRGPETFLRSLHRAARRGRDVSPTFIPP